MSDTETPAKEEPAKKTLSKRSSKTPRRIQRGSMENIIVESMETVPLTRLKTFPGNPRRGDINALAESLQTNSQYRPLVVQRSTSFILAGNHTYLAAQRLGWRNIAVTYIDVDDQQAKRIVVADNRLAELADYDGNALKAILEQIDDPTIGLGYTADDLEFLMHAQDEAATDALLSQQDAEDAPLHIPDMPATAPDDPVFGGVAEEPEKEKEVDQLAAAEDEIPGAFQLKDGMVFPGAGLWEIPQLRSDMLIEEMPEPLLTWAGTATKNWPDDVWWLYNFGQDSTYGMNDLSKIVLSFYSYDEFIEPWWWDPPRFVSKVLNSKISYAVTPNLSTEEIPKAISLWNIYRSRWLGRYFQEAGLRVVPDLEWRVGDEAFMKNIVCAGLPKKLTWASIQSQNSLSERTTGKKADEERLKQWDEDLSWFVNTLSIENLLVYTTEKAMDRIRSLGLPCELRFCETRWDVKRRIQPPRKQKAKEATL
jgi:ParB-like chromosome segregation protein Spo0J